MERPRRDPRRQGPSRCNQVLYEVPQPEELASFQSHEKPREAQVWYVYSSNTHQQQSTRASASRTAALTTGPLVPSCPDALAEARYTPLQAADSPKAILISHEFNEKNKWLVVTSPNCCVFSYPTAQRDESNIRQVAANRG